MATFVPVHGGGHGGWCYGKVARALRAAGHEVFGLADRAHLRRAGIDLDTHIADVAGLIAYEDLTDVILVGHSYGGMVVTGAGDRVPDRIREMVYLDAAHPREGESLRTVAPDRMEPLFATMTVEDGVELVMHPFPGIAGFLGVTDPADAAWLEPKLTPHPWACFARPLRLTNGDAVFRLRRTDINCTASLASSPPDKRARQPDGDRNYEIDTGHDLMVTESEWVARTLIEIAGTPARG